MAAEFPRDAVDADTSRTFGMIVGIEVVLAGLGAALLARRRRDDLISAWVALVVGLHLIPLAWLLRYPLLGLVAALVIVVAVLAVPWPGPARWPGSAPGACSWRRRGGRWPPSCRPGR
jgi:uncharacterized membrane protein YhaH (DUF805 family)